MQTMLQAKLDAVLRQMEVLKGQEAMIREMMREAGGEAPVQNVRHRAARSNVKSAVLDLLAQVGANGLNAAIAVDMASERGQNIERGSVSSLLSRLKNDGVVTYDGSLYRLAGVDAQNVHPLRTPGAAMR